MIVFILLLCCLCNASILHLRASLLGDVPTSDETTSENVLDIWPRKQCCNPYKEPGKYGNSACANNVAAKCCTNGQWSCPLQDGTAICNGVYTCGPFSSACEVKCCHPAAKPFCATRAKCCYDGQWSCVDPSGAYTCGGSLTFVSGRQCLILNADSQVDSAATDSVNADSQVDSVAADSETSSSVPESDFGTPVPDPAALALRPRIHCCNPYKEPGKYGNSACANNAAAKCCTNGAWSCPLRDGTVICNGIYTNCKFSSACEAKCCDPYKQQGKYNNPSCHYGAKCCYDGQWVCAEANGAYNCGGALVTGSSTACPIRCCFQSEKPQDCVYGPECCYDGKWACGSPDGTYQCGGSPSTPPFPDSCLIIPVVGEPAVAVFDPANPQGSQDLIIEAEDLIIEAAS